jgi:hypothetical protein
VRAAEERAIKMIDNQALKLLGDYLAKQQAGSALDIKHIANLLSGCWATLDGGNASSMRAYKLARIESATWNPPYLEFSIERHGQTVMGSSKETVHRWSVNVEKGTAGIIGEKRRQLYAMDNRLDVKLIAESLADAIVHSKEDERIAFGKDGVVRLKMSEIIPETNKQTTAARRATLRDHLSEVLAPHGWKELRPDAYHQPK